MGRVALALAPDIGGATRPLAVLAYPQLLAARRHAGSCGIIAGSLPCAFWLTHMRLWKQPADILTSAALPGCWAALDVGVTSPEAGGAGVDCCVAMHRSMRHAYVAHVHELEVVQGVVYRPVRFRRHRCGGAPWHSRRRSDVVCVATVWCCAAFAVSSASRWRGQRHAYGAFVRVWVGRGGRDWARCCRTVGWVLASPSVWMRW